MPSGGQRWSAGGNRCSCRACCRRPSTHGRCSRPGRPGETIEVENLVTARIDRQRIFGRPKPPSFWAVIDEGVLRRRIGSAKVMQDQLVHLAEMTERPAINVHVIPAEVGAHIGLLGAFAIAGFDGDAPSVVYFESPTRDRRRDSATVAKIILRSIP